jgi:hypothetical protein
VWHAIAVVYDCLFSEQWAIKTLETAQAQPSAQPNRQSTTDTVIPTSPAEDSVPAAPDQPQFFSIGSVTADLISCETV